MTTKDKILNLMRRGVQRILPSFYYWIEDLYLDFTLRGKVKSAKENGGVLVFVEKQHEFTGPINVFMTVLAFYRFADRHHLQTAVHSPTLNKWFGLPLDDIPKTCQNVIQTIRYSDPAHSARRIKEMHHVCFTHFGNLPRWMSSGTLSLGAYYRGTDYRFVGGHPNPSSIEDWCDRLDRFSRKNEPFYFVTESEDALQYVIRRYGPRVSYMKKERYNESDIHGKTLSELPAVNGGKDANLRLYVNDLYVLGSCKRLFCSWCTGALFASVISPHTKILIDEGKPNE